MSSEEAVRSTNDDASQCKRFAVEKGYWKDPYIANFGSRGKQIHAPEISIGYYARVEGLKLLTEKFLTLTSCKCQIVSLGAGFDTMYWNLKDKEMSPKTYVEVDFAAVTSRKIHYIRRSQVLLEKLSNEDDDIQFSSTDLHSKDYHLVAANLKNINELDKKLKECGLDQTLPTLFVAECVLVYIEKECTDKLLHWITGLFTNVLFINYEQVNMNDRFGQIMMDNLKARDCMLHVDACANLAAQVDRYTKQGFEGADAMEMRHVLTSLPQADVQRVERLEFLDERELLDQLMSHYCYSWAFKDTSKLGLADIDFT